jgi:hypothetical protein
MDKKTIIIVVLCIIGFVVFNVVRNCNPSTPQDTQYQPEIPAPEHQEEPELNAIALQHTESGYICWTKHGSVVFIESDKVIFEVKFEGNEYRLYVMPGIRILNFRGGNWDRAAYYLDVDLSKCRGSRTRQVN